MSLESRSLTASGSISPSRFVAGSAAEWTGQQASTNVRVVGISQEGTVDAPGTGGSAYAADDGDPFRVYGEGEDTVLELGGTVSAFDYLKSDSSGKGVTVDLTATSTQNVGAIAYENGVSGEKIKVKVKLQNARPA